MENSRLTAFQHHLKALKGSGDALPAEERINYLRQVLLFADEHYYIYDNPVLADPEYDAFFAELKELERAHPEFIHPSSPTQRVAQGRGNQLQPVQHIVPMLSLENSYNEQDLIGWDKRVKESLPGETVFYSVEPKYDGAGISLVYENNRLHIAATRGDGIMGEDITINAKQIKSIPIYADFTKDGVQTIEIRGEVVIKKETFKLFNEQRASEGLPPLANPRNAASGSLRILDPGEVKKRGLFAILYHISYFNNEGGDDPMHPVHQGHFESIQWLRQSGFSTPAHEMHLCASIEEVVTWCKHYEEKRDNMPYEVDGMVIKVNSFAQQEMLGMTSHHPRWAMAFKFKARQATSILRTVEFQVGRTGTVTPVAKIEPVHIGGVTISSISLFNEDVIREKDLKIGDTVLVERAGDVIPYIVKPIENIRTGTEEHIIFPKACPVCSSELHKPEGEAAWRCVNIDCPAQVVERMIHFVSKDAMDIRSLGGSNIRRFYELGFLKSIRDIYALPYESIAQLDKFGARSIDNLKNAIEKSKSQSLHKLIYALGIRFVGASTAKTLARAVNNILELKDWDIERLCSLEDIGPKVASSVADYFSNEENRKLIEDLAASGVAIAVHTSTGDTAMISNIFEGKTFLFTGTLSRFKRSEAEEMVEQRGGKILSGVSSKLHYLVVGAEAGSKLEKAKKLGNIKILTEQEFAELVHQ